MIIEKLLEQIRLQVKKEEGNMHILQKRIIDAKEHRLFERLASAVEVIPYFEQNKKTEIMQQLRRFQVTMDQFANKQKEIKIFLNKYLDKECKKIFIGALELQQMGGVVLSATFCQRKEKVRQYLEKYQQLYLNMLFWEHLGGLDSRYNKIDMKDEELKELEPKQTADLKMQTDPIKEPKQQQQQQQQVIVKEVIKEVIKDDSKTQALLDNLRLQIQQYQNKENEANQKLQLLKAHETVYGINTLQDVKGLEIYEQINTEQSLNALAYVYQQGKLVQQNIAEATQIYEENISRFNSVQAIFQMGKILMLNGTNLQQGVQYLKKAADQGHIEACLDLGILYYNGVYQGNKIVLERNQKMAIQYTSKGKHTGRGLCDLGIVESDPKKKVEYFTQSIKMKYWQAYYHFGQYYEENKEVELAKEQYVQGTKHQNINCYEALLKYLYQEAKETNSFEKFEEYLQQNAVTKQSGEAFYCLGLCNPGNLLVQKVYYQLGAKLDNVKCLIKLSEVEQELPLYLHYLEEGQKDTLLKMGEFYTKQGQLENAAQYFKLVQSPDSYRKLSEIYKNQNVGLSEKYEQMANLFNEVNSETGMTESFIIK